MSDVKPVQLSEEATADAVELDHEAIGDEVHLLGQLLLAVGQGLDFIRASAQAHEHRKSAVLIRAEHASAVLDEAFIRLRRLGAHFADLELDRAGRAASPNGRTTRPA